MRFLTAPMNCDAAEIDRAAFTDMLRAAREKFRYVLLDAPAGVDAGFNLAAGYADRVLLVTGADPAAVRDAGRAADILELMGKTHTRLVVNRVNSKMVSTIRMPHSHVIIKVTLSSNLRIIAMLRSKKKNHIYNHNIAA